jgi:hypothetical protein
MQGLVGTATQVNWITDSTNFFKTFLKRRTRKHNIQTIVLATKMWEAELGIRIIQSRNPGPSISLSL